MLFQHQPYLDQEPLQLSQQETAAVVDVVCGTAGSPSLLGVSACTANVTSILLWQPCGTAWQYALMLAASIIISLLTQLLPSLVLLSLQGGGESFTCTSELAHGCSNECVFA